MGNTMTSHLVIRLGDGGGFHLQCRAGHAQSGKNAVARVAGPVVEVRGRVARPGLGLLALGLLSHGGRQILHGGHGDVRTGLAAGKTLSETCKGERYH